MLMDLIPELSIFPEDGESQAADIYGSSKAQNDHERWKYAFRTLTRILSLHFSPVVILLDDLHWA